MNMFHNTNTSGKEELQQCYPSDVDAALDWIAHDIRGLATLRPHLRAQDIHDILLSWVCVHHAAMQLCELTDGLLHMKIPKRFAHLDWKRLVNNGSVTQLIADERAMQIQEEEQHTPSPGPPHPGLSKCNRTNDKSESNYSVSHDLDEATTRKMAKCIQAKGSCAETSA